MQRIVTVFLILMLPLAAAPVRADDARSIYNRELLKLDTAHDKNLSTWKQAYAHDLQALQEESQAAADTHAALAARDELGRFKKEQDLPDRDAPETADGIVALRTRFRDEIGRQTYRHARDILALTKKYTGHLRQQQGTLTRAGKLDDAAALGTPIEEAGKHPRVTAAQFVVDEYESRQPTPPQETGTAGEVKPSARQASTLDPRFAVYEGRPPPTAAQGHYRTVSLRPTGNVGLRAQVSARLSLSSHAPGTVAENRVRLGLRTKKTNIELINPIIYVHYFSKDTHVRSGKIQPHSFHIESLQLPSLQAAVTTVDFPDVIGVSSRSSYRYYRSYNPSSRSYEFYGVVVSIFTADGTLTFQGISSPSLADHALTTQQDLDAVRTRRY